MGRNFVHSLHLEKGLGKGDVQLQPSARKLGGGNYTSACVFVVRELVGP